MMQEDPDALHVVFGSTGAYGYAVAKKLLEKRFNVRAVVRNEEKANKMFPKGVEIVKADMLNGEEVSNACKGASAIYLGNNFPYRKWKANFMLSLSNILKGSKGTKPLIVFPGNVYGYGKFQRVPVDESHPFNASSRKGKLRNTMEALLMDYHRKGEIRVIIPRFADFYGPNVVNDLYGRIFRSAIYGKPAIWPANADVSHNLTYIEDAAEATILLMLNSNSYGKSYHVSGDVITAREFIKGVYGAAGSPMELRVLSKTFLAVAGLFNSNARELIELLYEYSDPYILDDSKFRTEFPSFKHTPYDVGIRETIDWFKANASNMKNI